MQQDLRVLLQALDVGAEFESTGARAFLLRKSYQLKRLTNVSGTVRLLRVDPKAFPEPLKIDVGLLLSEYAFMRVCGSVQTSGWEERSLHVGLKWSFLKLFRHRCDSQP